MVEELSPDSAPGLQRCRAPVFRCTSPVELQPHRPVVPQRPDTGVLQCCCVARLQLCRVAVSRCNGPVELQPHRPTDGDGNWIRSWRASLVTYGKSQHQAQALIRDAVASVVAYAKEAGKPIVLEKLDFRTRKAALEGESHRFSRMLSSFSYAKIKAFFIFRGCRQGVEVHQVNAAFSSVIGRVKFMERYGLSVHQAAALALARRLLGCSERIPRLWVCPIGNGVQVAFYVPARKRLKHVWTYWGAVLEQLGPALAAQHRLGKRRRRPNPVQAVRRAEVRGVA